MEDRSFSEIVEILQLPVFFAQTLDKLVLDFKADHHHMISTEIGYDDYSLSQGWFCIIVKVSDYCTSEWMGNLRVYIKKDPERELYHISGKVKNVIGRRGKKLGIHVHQPERFRSSDLGAGLTDYLRQTLKSQIDNFQ